MSQSQPITRSQRFAVNLPIRYRPAGDRSWQAGRIANISGSGILFRTNQPLDLNTNVEFTFELTVVGPDPLDMGTSHGPSILCEGHIVRLERTPHAGYDLALAAAIQNYRFVRAESSGTEQTANGRDVPQS